MAVHKGAVNRRTKSLKKACRNFRAKLKEITVGDDPNVARSTYSSYCTFIKKTLKYCEELSELYQEYCDDINAKSEEIEALESYRKKLYNENERMMRAKAAQIGEAYFSPEEEKNVREELKRKQAWLYKEKNAVEKMEKELVIRQEELAQAIKDTNLAKSSYYRLSEDEMKLFEEQRGLILAGVEKYGSISLAVKNNAKITMRVSSILHYAQKHQQFHEDIEIAKKVFKDSLDAEILDRALNGTVNPVFQKGEYIGDYAVKDNKLLVEVAKAKLPKEYNPRVYAQNNPQSNTGTTINIVSFEGVDETKKGYARNIGVVKSVDDTGRVERITQQAKDTKKMLNFYKEKGTADIIEAEVVKDDNN